MGEFDLITQYFATQTLQRKDVIHGIGDDCAIIQPIEGKQIAVTTDTLVSGVHFPEDTCPRAIGHKVVAVSLSDLAAAGAEPAWISLAITLPSVDQHWIEQFSAGLFELCEFYNVQLIGGDTTQGPLSITVTAQGLVTEGKALTRYNAKTGDWIYVTGEVGDAALALQHILGHISVEESFREQIQTRLDFPKPRVLAGQVIKDYASAAIDVSDGVVADLQHICECSKLGAKLVLNDLPISLALKESLPLDQAYQLALTGGDDYELLFTVSEDNKVGMETSMKNAGIKITCIGQMNGSNRINLQLNGKNVEFRAQGFEHFRA
jgi:thiamine-monophosphate kinase